MSNDKTLAIRNPIVPTDFDGFASLAATLSKSALIPQDLRNKSDDVFVTLLAGHELGLTPMASLRAIHVVKGKPILSADTMVALVLGRGSAVYFRCVEESDTSVTYETLRVGAPEPQRATWTITDAKRANLTGGNWTSYPRAMLKARCKSVLARDVYPDVLAGCYDETERDEIEGRRPAQPAPRRAPQPDPATGEFIDAEFTDAGPIVPPAQPDPWPALLAALEPIAGEPTGGWTEADVGVVLASRLAAATTPAACNDAMRPWVAAFDKAGKAPRIAAAKDAMRAAYKARIDALRAAQQPQAGAA